MLGVLHMGIAATTGAQEMMLSEAEAGELASALVPVLDQFDWMPDPRYAAIGGLIIVAGKLYIPRAVLIKQRMASERSEKKSKPAPLKPSNVTTFPAPVNSAAPGFADFGAPIQG